MLVAVGEFHVVDVELDVLLLRLGAYEQHIAGVGDDIVVKAVGHHQFLALYGKDVARRVVCQHAAVLGHVLVAVFGRIVVERAPCAEVVPAEIDTLDIHVCRALHHRVVNRYVDTRGELALDKLALALCGEVAEAAVEGGRQVGRVHVERLKYGLGRPQEYAGVPEELAALDKHLGQVEVGLFGECLHLEYAVVAFHGAPYLYVAVAGLGACGLDAESEQGVVVFDE